MSPIPLAVTGPSFERNACAPFYDRARRSPTRTALVHHDREISYADLVGRVDAIIDQLADSGVRGGDRVAYLGWNHPALLLTMLATARIGAVFVPINPRSAPAEIAFVLSDCGATAVVAGAEFQPVIDTLRDQVAVEVFLAVEGSGPGWQQLSCDVPAHSDALSRHPLAPTAPGDVAVLMYTSGTTGRAKGVMLTHGNIWAAVVNIMLVVPMTPDSALLGMAPLFHVAALSLSIATLATGGRTVLLDAFTCDGVFDAIERWKVTWTFGVPTMLRALQHHPRFASTDLDQLVILVGGSPVPKDLLTAYTDRGVQTLQGYGLTEAMGTVALLGADTALRKLGSAGLPFPLTEIELRDLLTREVIRDADTPGEVWIRGRTVSTGYWRLPEVTAEAFDSDGWLATGDIGRWDDEGYLYLVDRAKDMIISGGANVYPAEVEAVVGRYPGVAQVAVIGLSHHEWGEQVTAVIVAEEGAEVTLDGLQAFCRKELAGYKIPRRLELVPEIPLSASGKMLKRNLRTQFAPSTVDIGS